MSYHQKRVKKQRSDNQKVIFNLFACSQLTEFVTSHCSYKKRLLRIVHVVDEKKSLLHIATTALLWSLAIKYGKEYAFSKALPSFLSGLFFFFMCLGCKSLKRIGF